MATHDRSRVGRTKLGRPHGSGGALLGRVADGPGEYVYGQSFRSLRIAPGGSLLEGQRALTDWLQDPDALQPGPSSDLSRLFNWVLGDAEDDAGASSVFDRDDGLYSGSHPTRRA